MFELYRRLWQTKKDPNTENPDTFSVAKDSQGKSGTDLMSMSDADFERWLLNRQNERHIPDNKVRDRLILLAVTVGPAAIPLIKFFQDVVSLSKA